MMIIQDVNIRNIFGKVVLKRTSDKLFRARYDYSNNLIYFANCSSDTEIEETYYTYDKNNICINYKTFSSGVPVHNFDITGVKDLELANELIKIVIEIMEVPLY